jgi:MoaA/NifB/PqqE/SkfB family radical SAM enzyme
VYNINIEDEKIARLKSWMNGIPQGPISIHLDPSNRCNVKCRFCWMRSHEKIGLVDTSNELSDERFIGLAKEAYELGVKEWLLSGGGEPLIRGKSTIQLMKEIKKYKMHGDIISNGILFNEEDIKDLILLGWDRVRISITGPNAKIHDYLVEKEGAFEKATRNLRLFDHYKKKYKKSLPEIGFNSVISSVNYKHFPEMVELLKSVGGCLINVQTIILYSEEEKKWALNDEQRKELPTYLRRAINLCSKYKIHTNMGNYLNESLVDNSNQVGKMDSIMFSEEEGFLGSHCYEPWYLLTIRSNGIVGSCRLFGDKGDNLHNKSLKEIWYGDYFNNARKMLLNKQIPDYCKNCGANEYMQNQWIKTELTK